MRPAAGFASVVGEPGDVNGDGRADFEIAVTGLTALVSGDFIL